RERPDPRAREILDGVEAGVADAVRCGTAIVGDISNTLVTFAPLVASPLAAVVFFELIRFNAPDAAAMVEQARRDLEALGPTDRVLAVHGVQMTSGDLARLAARGSTLVTCPRSNAHTGAGAPPIEAFYRSGVRVAIGTDSLASTPDLNVFAELAAVRALAPSVP